MASLRTFVCKQLRDVLLIMGSVASLACGDPGNDTLAPDGRLEVVPRLLNATALGQTLHLTVTVGGRPASAALALRAEQRWLDDRAVLDDTALTSARLVSRAPGRAVVSVSAAGQTDSVVVSVLPAQVTVVEARLPGGRAHLGDGDTIVLRGYRMNQLTAGNVSATGVALRLAGADSANARLVLPTLASSGCAGAATAFSITFTGAQAATITGLSQKRSGELVLAAGEARRLTDAEAACIRLPRIDSARYFVAYADTRVIVKAQTQPEWPLPESFLVTGVNLSGAAVTNASRATSPAPQLAMASSSDPVIHHYERDGSITNKLPASLVPATCPFAHSFLPFCRTSPYRLGEEFLYYPATSARPAAQARVLAIRGNLVVSLFLPDSALLPPGTEAALDSALDIMERRAVPLMQHVFNLATPTRTSDESGQLFIAFEQFQSLNASGAATWWPDPSNGHGRWGKVMIAITPNLISPFSNRVQGLLVHEVLHTYQFRWRYEHASPWRTYLGGWAVEGSTTFFVLEIERDVFGYAFLGDSMPGGYAIPDTDLWNSPLAAASFMRHLTQRLMENGLTYDDALREAVVGALEGWWGINEEGQARGLGITARMRRHLGPGWHPVDALLDWTLTQAADGLTTNPKYQNRTVRYNIAPFTPLQPHGTLSGSAPVQRLRTGGVTGVFQIDDPSGGSYAMSSTIRGVPTDAPEWMILRIR